MTKFQVGDLVRVKKDLELRTYSMENKTYWQRFVSSMMQYRGHTYIIDKADDSGYQLKCDSYSNNCWFYTDSMLDLVEDRNMIKLVYIKFDYSDHAYSYITPVNLKKGEIVYVKTPSSKRHATVVGDSFEVTEETSKVMLKELGYTSFTPVIGYCVKKIERVLVPFEEKDS